MENFIVSARKYRPASFDTVIGQHSITSTLRNAILNKQLAQAYLFCGPRGVGKTTCARIFAKTINCMNLQPNAEPCNECESCKAFNSGRSLNIHELDAASNNSVDDIRGLVDQVRILPQVGKYSVYIIDEVHMLSIGAFNALLKTLEEPPEYVIFILATTEAHKIPITILSRCQRYDFKRITIDTIAARLDELMKKEQVEVEEKAIRYIAKAADGSMRDALSLLDQCIAFYLGQKLTYDHVLEVLGAVDTDVFSRLLRQIISQDVGKVLATVEELVMQGRELTQLAADFTWYLRNLLLVKTSDNMEDVLDVSTENLAQLKEEAQMIESGVLLRYIRIFSELTNQLKYATQKRVLLEVTLIKLCKPQMESTKDSLLDRIRALEKQVEEGSFAVAQPQERVVYVNGEAPKPQPKPQLPKALKEDIKQVTSNFRKIANEASGMLRGYLKQARLSVDNQDRLLIVLPDEISASVVGSEEHKQELKDLIEKKIGKTVEIDVRQVENGRHFEDSFVDIEKVINMEITIEDE